MSYVNNAKWRDEHPERARRLRREYYAKRRKNCVRAYKPWTAEESAQVLNPTKKKTDSQLARELGRSLGAVQSHRSKLKARYARV